MSRNAPAALLAALTLAFAGDVVQAQETAENLRVGPYAAFLDAPVVARVRIAEATPLKDPADQGRTYETLDVVTLIRAPGALPQRLRTVAEVATDSRGKAPKLKKTEALIAARPGVGNDVQLIGRQGQIAWTASAEARVRTLLKEAGAPDAAPAIKGVTEAFFAPGTVPGESETQVFLATATGRPASLSILRRPGEAPRWSAAFGDVVADTAPPAKGSVAYYRLACGLPATLPETAVAEIEPDYKAAAIRDYAFVRAQVGACENA